jgi:hypothetical protein
MPEQYAQFADVVLKRVSDTLPPNHLYNHKIKLTVSNDLCPSSLYKMSTEKLKIIKQYLINNLNKDFIEPSTALWAALVMFIQKSTRGLQFCIDF